MPTFRSYYPFKCILKYIPSRYCNLKDWQIANQKYVYAFKDKGEMKTEHKEKLLKTIKEIAGKDTTNCLLCFIPASTKERHQRRYGKLALYLQNNLDFPVMIDGITCDDRNSVHLKENKDLHPIFDFILNADFFGKKVILFDDVITTGESLRSIGGAVDDMGAYSVYGVIYAMTIHPQLPFKHKNKK